MEFIYKEDILALGIRIFMGLHQYPNIEDYWKDNILNEYVVPKVKTKAFFKLISTTLHFPEKSLENTDKIKIEAKKVKQLSDEQYIKALDFEFNLPLPNNKTYNRNLDIKKVLKLS